MKKNISKSRFLAGLQCEKRLWLEVHKRDLADEVNEQTQAFFDQGHLVGDLAQKLFLDGVLIREDHLHVPEAVKATEKAIQDGVQTIYEAGGLYDRVLARADILNRVEPGVDEWDMIEVKSSTGVKDVYLYDMAIQKYIFEGRGHAVRKTFICHINNQYVRQGEIELKKLFALVDVTPKVNKLIKQLPDLTTRFLKVVDSEKNPEVPIGRHCEKPYTCSFMGHCWKNVPEDSVFSLAGRKDFAEDLFQKGIVKLVDIPSGVRLSAKQKKQVEVARSGKPLWNESAIGSFLKGLEYPLGFLDFEGFMTAIPPYEGTRPFQQIPFQFSLDVIEKPSAEPKHFEFLADGEGDPRSAFAEALSKMMPNEGSVVVYNAAYEGRVLRETQEVLPKYKTKFGSILRRLKDISVPFRNQDVLYPEFHGSYSLKSVLPVMVPGMTYQGMEIGEGGEAVQGYVKLMDPKVSAVEKKKIRKDLLTYCGQDTMAMVKLLGVLREKVS